MKDKMNMLNHILPGVILGATVMLTACGSQRQAAINQVKPVKIEMSEGTSKSYVDIAAGRSLLSDGTEALLVMMNVKPDYYIYDHVADDDPYTPTTVTWNLPDGIKLVDRMDAPSGHYYSQNGTTVYKGSVIFKQRFTGKSDKPITVTVKYQSCNNYICFAPVEETLVLK